jgi:hypothetical protein
MSSKRKASSSRQSQVIEKIEKTDEKITYLAFFQSCLARGMVKPWQEKEINLFFRSLGLSDKETQDQYRDALRKY